MRSRGKVIMLGGGGGGQQASSVFRAALHMVISDFKVFIVFVALGLPFPQVHLSIGGGGGGGGGGVNRLPV